MTTYATMNNQTDSAKIKSLDELIAMAREVNAEFEKIHALMAETLDRAHQKAA